MSIVLNLFNSKFLKFLVLLIVFFHRDPNLYDHEKWYILLYHLQEPVMLIWHRFHYCMKQTVHTGFNTLRHERCITVSRYRATICYNAYFKFEAPQEMIKYQTCCTTCKDRWWSFWHLLHYCMTHMAGRGGMKSQPVPKNWNLFDFFCINKIHLEK